MKPSLLGQSVIDSLMDVLPELQIRRIQRKSIDPAAAKSLFSLWRNADNKAGHRLYKRPVTTPVHEVDRMKSSGLVQPIGKNLEITDKGAEVLRVMILGDNSSVFDDTGIVIDYNRALASSESPSIHTANKLDKQASQNWWKRYA
jgi:hypothetical protein